MLGCIRLTHGILNGIRHIVCIDAVIAWHVGIDGAISMMVTSVIIGTLIVNDIDAIGMGSDVVASSVFQFPSVVLKLRWSVASLFVFEEYACAAGMVVFISLLIDVGEGWFRQHGRPCGGSC